MIGDPSLRQFATTWTQRLQHMPALRPVADMLTQIIDALRDPADGSGGASRMALSTFAIRVGGAALAYVSQIILARLMGAHDYGIFSVAWTWIVVLGVMACCGFSSSSTRFVPEYSETGDLDRLRGFLLASRTIAFLGASLVTGAAIAMVFLLHSVIDSQYTWPMVVVLLALPMFAFGGVLDGIARSYDWPSLAMLPTYIWRPGAILVFLLLFIVIGQPATALTAAFAALAATWAIAVYQQIRLNGRLASRIPKGPRRLELRTWFAISMPMLMVEGFFQLITSADVIMVSFWRDPDEVAVYFAASKTLALVHFVYFAVRAASAHRFSRFVTTNDREGLAAYMHKATTWTFWPSLATGLAVLIAAPLLLSLFGKDFTSGMPLIAVLLVGILARASVGPVDALLNMSGNQKSCALIYAATFAVNVGLNVALIPHLGLMGAALGTSLAIIFEATCLTISARRTLGVQTFILPLLLNRKRTAA